MEDQIRRAPVQFSSLMDQRIEEVASRLRTGLVEVTGQMIVRTLLETMTADQICQVLAPAVAALDQERGERRRKNQQLSQLRHRLKKKRASTDAAVEEIAHLERMIAEIEGAR